MDSNERAVPPIAGWKRLADQFRALPQRGGDMEVALDRIDRLEWQAAVRFAHCLEQGAVPVGWRLSPYQRRLYGEAWKRNNEGQGSPEGDPVVWVSALFPERMSMALGGFESPRRHPLGMGRLHLREYGAIAEEWMWLLNWLLERYPTDMGPTSELAIIGDASRVLPDPWYWVGVLEASTNQKSHPHFIEMVWISFQERQERNASACDLLAETTVVQTEASAATQRAEEGGTAAGVPEKRLEKRVGRPPGADWIALAIKLLVEGKESFPDQRSLAERVGTHEGNLSRTLSRGGPLATVWALYQQAHAMKPPDGSKSKDDGLEAIDPLD